MTLWIYRHHVWLWPVMVFALIAGLSLVLYQSENWQIRRDLNRRTALTQAQVGRRIEKALRDLSRPLLRLSSEYAEGKLRPDHFVESVASVRRRIATLVVVGLYNADGKLLSRWAMPDWPDVSDTDAQMQLVLERTRQTLTLAATDGGPGPTPTVVLAAPAIGEGGELQGATVAVLDIEVMLEETLDPQTRADFQVDLVDSHQHFLIASTSATDRAYLVPPEKVQAYDCVWQLRLSPTSQFIAMERTAFPISVLLGGLALSLFLSAIIFQYLRLRQREREHARADAETKAMLLRELNHRVKNTLAGIVTLLQMDVPDISNEAQAWLDATVGRIRVIGRAHQLFVGGLERVDVEELVKRTLESLESLKPDGLELRVDTSDAQVSLRPERAVAFAMVLYELAYNAIRHGSGEQGLLKIKVTCSRNSVLAVSVEDDGAEEVMVGVGSSVHPRKGTGAGLTLVRAMVQRELKGRFELRALSEVDGTSRGSVATVELPLLDDEKGGLGGTWVI